MILQSHLFASTTDCTATDWTGGCTSYTAIYTFNDGKTCFGNNN